MLLWINLASKKSFKINYLTLLRDYNISNVKVSHFYLNFLPISNHFIFIILNLIVNFVVLSGSINAQSKNHQKWQKYLWKYDRRNQNRVFLQIRAYQSKNNFFYGKENESNSQIFYVNNFSENMQKCEQKWFRLTINLDALVYFLWRYTSLEVWLQISMNLEFNRVKSVIFHKISEILVLQIFSHLFLFLIEKSMMKDFLFLNKIRGNDKVPKLRHSQPVLSWILLSLWSFRIHNEIVMSWFWILLWLLED